GPGHLVRDCQALIYRATTTTGRGCERFLQHPYFRSTAHKGRLGTKLRRAIYRPGKRKFRSPCWRSIVRCRDYEKGVAQVGKKAIGMQHGESEGFVEAAVGRTRIVASMAAGQQIDSVKPRVRQGVLRENHGGQLIVWKRIIEANLGQSRCR